MLTTLRFFRSEYEAHIRDRRCPAKRCKALIRYEISAETCIGCGACLRLCPAKAIEGEPKRLHRIDPARCTRCGLCVEACKFGAVAAE